MIPGIEKTEQTDELFRRGNLRFLLTPIQRIAYDDYFNNPQPLRFYKCHRGFGKTFLEVAIAISASLRVDRNSTLIGGPTKVDLYEILEPLFETILFYCPKDCLPKFSMERGVWSFPNKSKILLFGTKNADKKARGKDVHDFLFDEAAFSPDTEKTIQAVIMPRLLRSSGRGAIFTTPPEFPTHPIVFFENLAEERGTLVTLTYKDNPSVTLEEYNRTVAHYGGEDNPKFRREFMCEVRVDLERIVCDFPIPVKKAPTTKPELVAAFLAEDLGGIRASLLTAEVHRDGVYITHRLNLSSWSEIEHAVQLLPTNTVVMTDYSLDFIDLTMPYTGIRKSPAVDSLEGSIASVKTIISRGLFFLDPSTADLSERLKLTVWDKKRKGFEPDFGGGTFSDVRAMAYLAAELQFVSVPSAPEPHPIYQRHLKYLKATHETVEDVLGRS